MTDRLKASAKSLHGLTPEGRHVPHRFGTAADKAALRKVHKNETDSAVRAVRAEQVSKFIVVSDEHAERHAVTLERKTAAADALIDALGLRGKGKPGVIAEADARRYLVKVYRELRHQIAVGATVDMKALSEAVAEHLGTENKGVVISALSTERSLFTAEHAAAKEELGEHHIFHEDIGFVDARLQG